MIKAMIFLKSTANKSHEEKQPVTAAVNFIH